MRAQAGYVYSKLVITIRMRIVFIRNRHVVIEGFMKALLCPHVAWRRIDDETFVINLEKRVMYALNDSGSHIWSLLEEGHDLHTIVTSVAASFKKIGTAPDLEFSVYTFLRQLKNLELITFDGALPSAKKAPPTSIEPLPGPRIEWQEELASVGYSCAQKPGQTPACTQVPSQ